MGERVIPEERTTAQQNHLTVVLDSQTGSVKLLSDRESIRGLVEATRRAEQRGDLKLLAGHAA